MCAYASVHEPCCPTPSTPLNVAQRSIQSATQVYINPAPPHSPTLRQAVHMTL